ncbi:uncharacterized protein LOC111710266 [Eurytemora carolleeae]|uniref:uncharacterized protein LOC111710266 n=1 Tax=Eurytemora carolleeae TaxID=1294199 RepID=UPI000C790AA9|nr:uncharacterized protein LOC111710266 [Eurytemora carolleeae]|eukprot:XP_023340101.1 uncharacterized protein LOC111710266 [Eurytemora affinis]
MKPLRLFIWLYLIPVKNRQYEILSLRSVLSFMIWFCIPMGLFSIPTFLESVPNYELMKNNPVIMASTISILINGMAIALSMPGLLANLVEKSEVDLDVSKYTKKWVAMYMIIFTAATILFLMNYYSSENFVFICPTMITFQSMLAMLVSAYLITTNLVCISFIEEATDLTKEDKDTVTISRSMNLVKKMKMLKSGFSPLLFSMLVNYSVNLVVCSYSGLYFLKLRQYFMGVTQITMVAIYLLIVYSLICSCDEVFQALSANNDKLRKMSLMADDEMKHKILTALEMIREEGPFTALGFFEVNKSTFMTIIGCTINYLVIMLSL